MSQLPGRVAMEWASDTDRRTLVRIPANVTHREKWRLALDMLDTLAGWGMTPPVVVADAAHGPTRTPCSGIARFTSRRTNRSPEQAHAL